MFIPGSVIVIGLWFEIRLLFELREVSNHRRHIAIEVEVGLGVKVEKGTVIRSESQVSRARGIGNRGFEIATIGASADAIRGTAPAVRHRDGCGRRLSGGTGTPLALLLLLRLLLLFVGWVV